VTKGSKTLRFFDDTADGFEGPGALRSSEQSNRAQS
jgi:hypothetical protein